MKDTFKYKEPDLESLSKEARQARGHVIAMLDDSNKTQRPDFMLIMAIFYLAEVQLRK